MSSDVKWIKLTTSMFDNRKIKHLRKLPEGNNIVLIWVMLLTMAGRCNANGFIFLTENIPYTPKMLSDELGFDENVIQVALSALEKFEMIHRDGEFLSIPGWEEHQNAEGLEKVREQTRKRVAEHRKRQERKAIELECNVTCNVTETLPLRNVTQQNKNKEIDKDKEKEIEVDINTPPISPSKEGELDKPKTQKKEPVVYYPNDKLLDSAFKEFLVMRNKIKKPIATKQAMTRIKNKIEKLSGGDNDLAILILNQSTDHCWQDVYPLKEESQKQTNNVFDEWRNA